MEVPMRSEDVVALTGITRRRLLYLVSEGMVTPTIRRSEGSGHSHRFSAGDVAVIELIMHLQELGLTFKAIREMRQQEDLQFTRPAVKRALIAKFRAALQ